MNVAECGGPLGHGLLRNWAVVHVQLDRPLDVPHDDIADPDVLDDAAAAAVRLHADPVSRAVEDAVGNHDVFDAAGHFAADDDAAMTGQHRAIGDRDVLAGPAYSPAVLVSSRLDRDAVVTDVNVTVADPNIAAGVGVNAVRIGRVLGIDNGQIREGHVLAVHGVHGPGRRVLERYSLDQHVLAAVKADQSAAGILEFLAGFPPDLAPSIDDPPPCDGDVPERITVDEARIMLPFNPLPAAVNDGVVIEILTAQNARSRVDVERHVAL